MNRKDAGKYGNLFCSFCGKNQDEVRKHIAGPSVYICDECIELCNDIIAEQNEREAVSRRKSTIPKPYEIKAALDDYVIGQDRAMKILSVAVNNHYKRVDSSGRVRLAGVPLCLALDNTYPDNVGKGCREEASRANISSERCASGKTLGPTRLQTNRTAVRETRGSCGIGQKHARTVKRG